MRPLLAVLLLWSPSLFADNVQPVSGSVTFPPGGAPPSAGENLVRNGNFEAPAVKGRKTKAEGGNPVLSGGNPGWVFFKIQNTGTNGKVIAGLTDEVARSGRQCYFVDFDHVASPYQSAELTSNFIPVVSGTDYEIGIWGRTDAKDLINSEGRSAYMKLEVDFFAGDGNRSVGDPYYSVLPVPGSKDHDPIFKPDAWKSYFVKVTTPPEAVFAQIIWHCETGSDEGEINGILYFDDATMVGPAVANPNMTPAPAEQGTPDPATPGQ